jgi:hypothetical protein
VIIFSINDGGHLCQTTYRQLDPAVGAAAVELTGPPNFKLEDELPFRLPGPPFPRRPQTMNNTEGDVDDRAPHVPAQGAPPSRAESLADVLDLIKAPMTLAEVTRIGGDARPYTTSSARNSAAKQLLFTVLDVTPPDDNSAWGKSLREAILKTADSKNFVSRAAWQVINVAGPLVHSKTVALYALAVILAKDVRASGVDDADLAVFDPAATETATMAENLIAAVYTVLLAPGADLLSSVVDRCVRTRCLRLAPMESINPASPPSFTRPRSAITRIQDGIRTSAIDVWSKLFDSELYFGSAMYPIAAILLTGESFLTDDHDEQNASAARMYDLLRSHEKSEVVKCAANLLK